MRAESVTSVMGTPSASISCTDASALVTSGLSVRAHRLIWNRFKKIYAPGPLLSSSLLKRLAAPS